MISINLIKVDTHSNKIALYKEFDNKKTFFIKESTDTNSNNIIEREYQGYKWYFKNILKKENLVNIRRNIFNELIIPEFVGKHFTNEKKFHLKTHTMSQIINYYKKFWPTDSNFAIHGDMGLSNFIFNEDIILIDWEHYHKSDMRYYGFDIINMLFISFYYRINNKYFNSYEEKCFIRDCYKKLFDKLAFNSLIKRRPFYESKNYIINNYHKYGGHKILIGNKFVLASFPDEILNRLDSFVTS